MSTPTSNTLPGNILDGIIWGDSWDLSTNEGGPAGILTYQPITSLSDASLIEPWNSYELTALDNVLSSIEAVSGIEFLEVSSNPNIQFGNISGDLMEYWAGPGVLGLADIPNDGYEPAVWCNVDGQGWSASGLAEGGYGYVTLLHETLHVLGLAHPHDTGGISTIFDGVSSPWDYGDDELNQGIYTTMTYNDGYPELIGAVSIDFGYQFTPMALDIAALQYLYGTNGETNSGDNIYYLADDGDGTAPLGWSCIWDTGGTDTISANSSTDGCVINLTAADLTGADAGGYASYGIGEQGGYTIANQVVIENIIGSVGDDELYGNSSDNEIYGGAGDDFLYGGGGNDIILGGDGTDELYGGAGQDVFVYASFEESPLNINGFHDVIFDFEIGDLIDLTLLGAVELWASDHPLDPNISSILNIDRDGDGIADLQIDMNEISFSSLSDNINTMVSFNAAIFVEDYALTDNGSYALYKLDSGYVVDVSGLTNGDWHTDDAVSLMKGHKDYPLKATPDGIIVADNGSIQLITESGGKWSYLQFNDMGMFSGKGKLAFSEVLALEVQLGTDLNGDGGIGNTVVSTLTVSGDYTLYDSAAGYVVDVSGLTGGDSLTDDAVSLMKGHKDYPLKATPDGIIVADNGSIQLITESGGKWSYLQFNDMGMFSGKGKLAFSEVLALEVQLGTDLNGDGGIGNTVVSALTVSGDYTLYDSAAGYVVDVSGLTGGDSLTDDAVSLMKGHKDYPLKATPDGIIVADNGSIQLITESGGKWSYLQFNDMGMFSGKGKLAFSEVLALEVQLGTDLNGDGGIGNTVVSTLTVSGDYTLYDSAAGYVVDVSGLTGGDSLTDDAVSLMKGHKDYPLKATPDGIIVADNGSIQLITESGGKWSYLQFNDMGMFSGKGKLAFSEVLALEVQLGTDLNGDGGIGNTVVSTLTVSGDYTLYDSAAGYVVDVSGLTGGDSLTDDAVSLMKGHKDYPLKATPDGIIVADNGSIQLITESGGKWSYLQFNDMGMFSGKGKLTLSEVLALESEYGIDINGDSVIETVAKYDNGSFLKVDINNEKNTDDNGINLDFIVSATNFMQIDDQIVTVSELL